MTLIFLSWIYILFTTVNIGFLSDTILNLKTKNFVVFSILGLFTTTLLGSIWAIFSRINIEFHIVLFVINIIIILKNKKEIQILYLLFYNELISLSKHLKIIISIITLLIIAQCASVPYILDNESYYIQTIKWINEYGFVKGLANLHFFLAQTSGWHITQSIFNFSFLYAHFNDLSGFCLFLGNLFAILKLNTFFKNQNPNYLIIGLLPLANLYFFQFISSPSPDLPIYIFSLILFFYFLESDKNKEKFQITTLLVLYCLYIKITSIVLITIPVLLLIREYRAQIPVFFKLALLSTMVLALYIMKNSIISGHPFFPITGLKLYETDYDVPDFVTKLYYQQTKLHAYSLTEYQYSKTPYLELIKHWLTLPKLHGFFNKTSILIILISPFFIYKFSNKKKILVLYFIMLLQLLLLLLTSPQYRFFMNFILFFIFFLVSLVDFKKSYIISFLYFSIIMNLFFIFIPTDINLLTKNKFSLTLSTFSIRNIIFPYKKSKIKNNFELIKNGNLRYYSPTDNAFFWGTGDGLLPCINKNQIEYFNYYYKIKPQMRTNYLGDGFYTKETSKE
jgi:hypothetical protein